jgi:hypothetical protein
MGDMRECYTGHMDTQDVGPCSGGTQMCLTSGVWGNCVGQVLPAPENCSDGIDNNCNGMIDEDVDADGDGFTTCGGDCCDSTECGSPALVNPTAFDVPGNNVDDDCNGTIDDTIAVCDVGIASNSNIAMDYARSIDLCQQATMADKKWGVLEASLTLADGTGVPAADAHSIRTRYGTNVTPQGGQSMMMISTGIAGAATDTNPMGDGFYSADEGTTSGFPTDFLAANGGTLPNAPGCPAPLSTGEANDPVMLTLKIRVPSNAHSFSIKSNFYSSEFPEYTCSPYNDFFVILLDSAYAGTPPNPTDKNLAFYSPMNSTMKYPVGVNLAAGNTGLFTQCNNGSTGCFGTPGSISTCISTNDLIGTGMDTLDDACDAASTVGGATGWLSTTGNVVPGEIITVRIGIWDTSDPILDSLALIDAFTWSVEGSDPGTVIGKAAPPASVPGAISQATGLAVPTN